MASKEIGNPKLGYMENRNPTLERNPKPKNRNLKIGIRNPYQEIRDLKL